MIIESLILYSVQKGRNAAHKPNYFLLKDITFHRGMIFYFNVLTRDKHNQVCWSHMISSK